MSWTVMGARRAGLGGIWLDRSGAATTRHEHPMIKTEDPGTIIYEDGWQIVAKPRRGQAKHSW